MPAGHLPTLQSMRLQAYHFRLLFLPGSWYPIMVSAHTHLCFTAWRCLRPSSLTQRLQTYDLNVCLETGGATVCV